LPAGLSLSPVTGASTIISGTPTASGSYGYTLIMTDSGTPPQTASQAYNGKIISASSLSLSSAPLTFSYQPGGVVPPTQSISTGTTPGIAFTVTLGPDCSGSGISVTPASGTTPDPISISATPAGLNPGTYNCTITVSSGGVPQPLYVIFKVGGAIRVSPSTLNFSYVAGDPTPAAQTLAVSTDGGNATVPFTASPGCSWLTVTPTNGSTPFSLSVSVSPAGLAPNTYVCTTLTVSGGAANNQSVTVNLIVSPPPAAPPLTVRVVHT
jgi:hypothetical protein